MKYEMKKHILRIAFVLTILGIGFQTADAQKETRLDSSPKAFRTFFAKFRKAIEKNDMTSIAAMTRFPFKVFYDSGNEAMLTKSEFIERVNFTFDDEESDFFIEDNPELVIGKDKEYVVITKKGRQLVFAKTRKSFKFVSHIVEP